MMKTLKKFFVLLLILSLGFACNEKNQKSLQHEGQQYKTRNVVIMIMDGARYTETWGDPMHQYIPLIAKHIAPVSVVCDQFFNEGPTYTNAGHTAITTAFYEEINNSGFEFPSQPSVFQYYNCSMNVKGPLSYVITSKDKLSILANTRHNEYKDKFLPAFNCGTDGSGNGSGYRNDSLTCLEALDILRNEHPRLVLINFLEPDAAGHSGNWEAYLDGIRSTDAYIHQIWEFLQTDKFYKDSTTVFITNDHGRHTDGVLDGFVNHGCPCEGCRHLFMFAAGPDFKRGVTVRTHYELIDVAPTTARLMNFWFPADLGKPMLDLFDTHEGNTGQPEVPAQN